MFQSLKKTYDGHRSAIGIVLIFTLLAVMLSSAVSATEQSTHEKNIQGWIARLNEEQETPARLEAQQQLERAGEPGATALLAALDSSNPVLRRNAAEVLGYIAAPRTTDPLRIALASDPDPRVRVEAVWALSQLNSPALLTSLERASALDRDERVRKAAADAIDGLYWSIASLANKDVRSVRAVATSPTHPAIAYLATSDEILVSDNGGKTWQQVASTPSTAIALAVSPAHPDLVYAGTETRGLFKSGDRGRTWVAVSSTLGEEEGMPVSATAVSFDPENPDHLFVAEGTWIGTSQARLFPLGVVESHDAGRTWTARPFPTSTEVITRLIVEGKTLYGLAGGVVLSTEI